MKIDANLEAKFALVNGMTIKEYIEEEAKKIVADMNSHTHAPSGLSTPPLTPTEAMRRSSAYGGH